MEQLAFLSINTGMFLESWVNVHVINLLTNMIPVTDQEFAQILQHLHWVGTSVLSLFKRPSTDWGLQCYGRVAISITYFYLLVF